MKYLLLLLALSSSVQVGAFSPSRHSNGCSRRRSLLSAVSDTRNLYTPPPSSLVDKTIVITGATSGLGLESARRLATAGANLVLTARTDSKGQAAVDAVESYLKESGSSYGDTQRISYKLLDLDNLATVKNVGTTWDNVPQIDMLLNNAGVMALPERQLTTDGFEQQMQSNHLGHFALTSVLSSKFSDDCRIISVSSEAHKMAKQGLAFDYKADSGYSAWKAYGQSKLANILFTQELQRRAQAAGLGWVAATLHPGVVATDLGRYMMGTTTDAAQNDKIKQRGNGGFLKNIGMKLMTSFLKTPEQGATTQVWLVSGADGEDVRGKYFSDRKARVLDAFATDPEAAARLWEDSERLTGIEFPVQAKTAEKQKEAV